MAKKRTLSPFYTKSMQRVTAAARRSGDVPLILQTTRAVRHALRVRAFRHLMRHSWPSPRTGVNYGAIDGNLGLMARFS
jgi:hypothetical protein